MRPMRSRISPAALFVNVTARMLARVDALDVDQSRDPRRQHAGLSRTGAGEHEQRAVDVEHGLALRRVEAGGQLFIEQHRHQ